MFGSSIIRCTGIHVVPDAVYAVELSRRRQRVSLSRCAVVRTERPLSMPQSLVDDQDRARLVEVLRQLRRSGIDARRPYFALSEPASFIKRRFVLPHSAEATRQQLLWEAGQLLGSDVDEYVVDTLVTRRHGFFIAARRQILDLYGALCRQARVGKPGFDMVSFALCNALESRDAGGDGVEVILQDDGGSARAVLLRDGEYEAESIWSLDDVTVADGLARLCEAELDEDETARRLWVAGHGDIDGSAGLERLADEVVDLDPFVGLPMTAAAGRALESSQVPPRAFAVAAGLAFRGLADA